MSTGSSVGRSNVAIAPLVGAAVAILSLATLCPDIHVHDSGELVGSGWFLGISHPPGVPLYELLLHLFLRLVPFGSIAVRANLFSALCLGGAAGVLTDLALRIGTNGWLATAAGLAFGAAPTVWSQGTMAEVYSLAALLSFLALSELVEAWATRAPFRLLRFAFLWGLLLTTHMAFSIVTPLLWLAIAGGLARSTPRPHRIRTFVRSFVSMSAAFLVPFSLYLYLPLRARTSRPFDWGDPSTLPRWFFHLTNRANQSRMLSLSIGDYASRGRDYLEILSANLGGPIVPILAATAILVLLVRPPRGGRAVPLVLALLWGTDAAFIVLLDTAPLGSEAYAIPSIALLLLLLVAALSALPIPRRILPAALLLPVALAVRQFPESDRSGDFLIRDEADAILRPLPTGATLFSRTDSRTFPIAYRQLVARDRTDVEVFDRDGNLFRRLQPVQAEIPPADRPRVLRDAENLEIAKRLASGLPVFATDADLAGSSTPAPDLRISFRAIPSGVVHPVLPVGAASSAAPPPAGFDERRGARPIENLDWMCREVLAATTEAVGDTLLARGDRAGAEERFRKAGDLSRQGANHFRLAQRWEKLGRAEEAEAELRRSDELTPRFAPAAALRASLARARGDAAGAEAETRRALALDPSIASLHENLGVLLAGRGDFDGAAAELGESIRLDPAVPSAFWNLALAERKRSRPAESLAALRSAAALAPASLRIRASLAEAELAAGSRPRALAALRSLPAELPIEAGDLDRYCAAAFRLDDPEPCRTLVRRALAAHPNETPFLEIGVRAGVLKR